MRVRRTSTAVTLRMRMRLPEGDSAERYERAKEVEGEVRKRS